MSLALGTNIDQLLVLFGDGTLAGILLANMSTMVGNDEVLLHGTNGDNSLYLWVALCLVFVGAILASIQGGNCGKYSRF